jgi:hypothetical protein
MPQVVAYLNNSIEQSPSSKANSSSASQEIFHILWIPFIAMFWVACCLSLS